MLCSCVPRIDLATILYALKFLFYSFELSGFFFIKCLLSSVAYAAHCPSLFYTYICGCGITLVLNYFFFFGQNLMWTSGEYAKFTQRLHIMLIWHHCLTFICPFY